MLLVSNCCYVLQSETSLVSSTCPRCGQRCAWIPERDMPSWRPGVKHGELGRLRDREAFSGGGWWMRQAKEHAKKKNTA